MPQIKYFVLYVEGHGMQRQCEFQESWKSMLQNQGWLFHCLTHSILCSKFSTWGLLTVEFRELVLIPSKFSAF